MARIVLVGPADSLTRLLAERLEAAPATVGEDLLAAEVEAIVFRPRLAGLRNACPDLEDADRFVEACLRALGARDGRAFKIVLLSSAAAHPPSHHNPGYLGEEEHPRNEHPIARSWRELERRVGERLAGTGAEVVVLRPAPVAVRDGEDFLCRLLRGKAAVVPAGYDPSLQILHPDDLVEAVRRALERGSGAYHVAPAGAIPVRGALRLAPRLGRANPAPQLEYLRHSSTVSGRKIERELGFVPQKTSAENVRDA